MNFRTYVRAFALGASILMLSASLAPTAEASLVETDLRARGERFQASLATLTRDGPTPGAVREARAAFEEIPPASMTAEERQMVDQMLKALDDPAAAQIIAPLLRVVGLGGTDLSAVSEAATRSEAATQKLIAGLGFDQTELAQETEALQSAVAGFDLSSSETFLESLQKAPAERAAAFTASLFGFVHRWSQTSNSEVARSLDAAMGGLDGVSPEEVQAGRPADEANA